MDNLKIAKPEWNIKKLDNGKYQWIVRYNDRGYFCCEYVNDCILIIKASNDSNYVIGTKKIGCDKLEEEIEYLCECFN